MPTACTSVELACTPLPLQVLAHPSARSVPLVCTPLHLVLRSVRTVLLARTSLAMGWPPLAAACSVELACTPPPLQPLAWEFARGVLLVCTPQQLALLTAKAVLLAHTSLALVCPRIAAACSVELACTLPQWQPLAP